MFKVIFRSILILSLTFSAGACSQFQTPKTVVDSNNGTTIDKDPPPAKTFSDSYLIPTLVALVLGGYFMKCADTGNCK